MDKNDPILGFFHRWIYGFAQHFDLVTVICLEQGFHELPANVKVLSLGKEKKASRVGYLVNFYSYIWKQRKNYDAVFVHMNPIYVVLGGPIWKILNKKIFLWYTHKNVDLKLRIAEKFAYKIFTASKESFRLVSKKVKVMGHGIDVEEFSRKIVSQTREEHSPSALSASVKENVPPVSVVRQEILSVGRISRTKNQLAMIQGFEILRVRGYSGTLIIVGGPVTEDDIQYKKDLETYIALHDLNGAVVFKGSVRPDDIVNIYNQADIFINLSSTGSLDKAVLEAMACNLKVLTSNDAFKDILPAENITDGTLDDIAAKIEILSKRPVDLHWRDYVVANHSLSSLINRLSEELKESQRS